MDENYSNRYDYMRDCEAICSVYFKEYMERVVSKRSVTNTSYEKYKGLVVSFEEAREGYEEKNEFVLSEQAKEKVARMYEVLTERVTNSEIFLPMEYISRIFGLSPLEKLMIVAAYLPLFDRSYEKTYGYINDNVNRHDLLPDTAVRLFANGDRQLLKQLKDKGADCLFEPSGAEAIEMFSLKPCKRVADILFDGRMAPEYDWVEMYYPSMETVRFAQRNKIQQEIEELMKRNAKLLVCLEGRKGTGRKSLLKIAAKEQKQSVMFVNFALFAEETSSNDIHASLAKLVREMLIQQCFVCLYNWESETDGKLFEKCIRELEKITGTVFICSEKKASLKQIEEYQIYYLTIDELERTESFLVWNSFQKPLEQKINLQEYVNKYNFTPGEIKKIVTYADNMADMYHETEITQELLDKSCNTLLADAFQGKAVQVEQKFGFDDLILPEEQKNQIKEALNHILYRNVVYDEWGFEEKLAYGKGLNMLFAGPPGTGKTMAAGIVGKELGLPVYKVDISQMVSKYIGETEKSLGEVFDIAGKNNSILFFDEMDSLFGKRSEVKDSHDKYANIETSYLLQKLEDYEGIVLMSTNFQQNIDEAFIRRINYVIQFPMPDVDQREKLWRSMFTKKMPVDTIDFKYLAEQFTISGAVIKSTVMSAAFIAAEKRDKIGMYHILRALKRLMQKQGKIMLDSEFGQYSIYLYDKR